MIELNDAEQATVYLSMMTMLQCGPTPQSDIEARRAGTAFAIAYLHDRLALVFALADAIEEHVGMMLGEDSQHEHAAVKTTAIAENFGPRTAKAAALIAGFYWQEVGGKTVKSDAPNGHDGALLRVSFKGLHFDGATFQPSGHL